MLHIPTHDLKSIGHCARIAHGCAFLWLSQCFDVLTYYSFCYVSVDIFVLFGSTDIKLFVVLGLSSPSIPDKC